MTDKRRLRNIVRSIRKGKLSLPEGGREGQWFCYHIHAEQWSWERNLIDGWGIDVYYNSKREMNYLGSIETDTRFIHVKIKVDE